MLTIRIISASAKNQAARGTRFRRVGGTGAGLATTACWRRRVVVSGVVMRRNRPGTSKADRCGVAVDLTDAEWERGIR